MTEWTANLLWKIRGLGLDEADLQKLYSSPLADPVVEYNHFMHRLCGVAATYPTHPFGTTFPLGDAYADEINLAVYPVVLKLAADLYGKICAENVPGALVEFGVADGAWLKMMLELMERLGQIRKTWGFDSFEGLPSPDAQQDSMGWREGQFANGVEAVTHALRGHERSHLTLTKGWFSESLRTPAAESIRQIAYAKVDCDLYGSAVDCLAFLKGRLSNGAVLVFDEWTHMLHLGETRAFFEWVPKVPEYRFELIGFINYRIFFRVWAS